VPVASALPSPAPPASILLANGHAAPHGVRHTLTPISFAYTSSDRPAVNTLLVQPIALVYVGRGFYVKSSDATWVMGWRDGSPTTIPLSLGVGYVLLRPDWPVLNFSVSGEWMAYRHDAPVAAQTSVNFGLSLAFPNLRPWE
jgi:hypothetical protein